MANILFIGHYLEYLDPSYDNYNPEIFQITYQREAKYHDYRQSEFQRMWDELMVYPAKALYEAKNAYIYTMNKIDELGNTIGRKLGVESNTTSMKELALITLKYYYTDGLYIAVEDDSGGYNIIKEKLSHEKYQYMKSTFENLDENGNPFK